MRRDWDLIRDILLKLETLPPSINIDETVIADEFLSSKTREKVMLNNDLTDLENKEIELVNSHFKLLIEAGLIVGHCEPQQTHAMGDRYKTKQHSNYECYGVCLTWRGYDFIDAIRDNSMWKKICKKLASKSIELSIDTVFALAKKFAMDSIGI